MGNWHLKWPSREALSKIVSARESSAQQRLQPAIPRGFIHGTGRANERRVGCDACSSRTCYTAPIAVHRNGQQIVARHQATQTAATAASKPTTTTKLKKGTTKLKKGIFTLTALLAASTASFSAAIVVPPGSTVIASWSFDAAGTTNTGMAASAGPADIGSGTAGSSATALHASAATVYSNPSGNGSLKSFSSNNWAVGDYYQFSLATTGSTGIYVTFGQFGSNTGPRDFKLSYSTDGTTFADFASYAVLSAPSWSTTAFHPEEVYSYNLSAITALDNASTVTFRLIDTSTVSINGGTVAAGGTGRVDDFTVSMGPVTLVPEPATAVCLLGGAGMLFALRRRSLSTL